LRDAVFTATGGTVDLFDHDGSFGDVLKGIVVPVTAGMPLGRPQIIAAAVPGQPGYWTANAGKVGSPHAQVEFFLAGYTNGGDIDDVCFYSVMDPTRQAELQAMFDADVADPESWSYGISAPPEAWIWKAEADLQPYFAFYPRDFSELTAWGGVWFERTDEGTVPDEMLAWIPIARGVASYDPANYHSPEVATIVFRKRTLEQPFRWRMPDLSFVDPRQPVGEVIEHTSTHLLVKWRDMDWMGGTGHPTPVYQSIAWGLDDRGLMLKLGSFADTPGTVVAPPAVKGAEICNEITVLCYDHRFIDGL
jgi:hypothetical protein